MLCLCSSIRVKGNAMLCKSVFCLKLCPVTVDFCSGLFFFLSLKSISFLYDAVKKKSHKRFLSYTKYQSITTKDDVNCVFYL